MTGKLDRLVRASFAAMRTPIAALTLTLSFALACSQASSAQTSPDAVAVSDTDASLPARLAAARELFEVMDLGAVTDAALDVTLDAQLEQMPMSPAQRPAVDSVMRAFFAEHMAFAKLADRYALAYAEQLTLEELQGLIAFYRTPLGRRLAEATPALTAAGARIGQEAVEPHTGELQAAIMAVMRN